MGIIISGVVGAVAAGAVADAALYANPIGDEIRAALKTAPAPEPNAAMSAANAMWQNSGIAPKTTAVDFTKP